MHQSINQPTSQQNSQPINPSINHSINQSIYVSQYISHTSSLIKCYCYLSWKALYSLQVPNAEAERKAGRQTDRQFGRKTSRLKRLSSIQKRLTATRCIAWRLVWGIWSSFSAQSWSQWVRRSRTWLDIFRNWWMLHRGRRHHLTRRRSQLFYPLNCCLRLL